MTIPKRNPGASRWRPVLFAGAWLLVGALMLPFVLLYLDWGPEPDFRRLEYPDCAAVTSRYGVQVVTPDGPVAVTFASATAHAGSASETDLRRYAPVFAEEFNLYPPEFVRQARLQKVVFCANLTMNARPVAGFADCGRGTIYLDVNYLAADPTYVRKTIHHEFFHILDYHDDWRGHADPEWAALNVPGVRYGKGGWTALSKPNSGELSNRFPGFLNHYSTTGVEEDKAEVFANLMVEPRYVKARVLADPVLRAKVARMKKALADFCPAVDAEFWERAEQAKREAK